MTIYFWSDTHFSHDKEFIYKSRGFQSIEEHDETILTIINSTVDMDDDLYLLGDIIMGDTNKSIEYLKRIKCKIHIILGNHDNANRYEKYKDCANVFSIGYGDMIVYKKWHFLLSHYPSVTSNYDDSDKSLKYRTWNLCGHTHTKDKFENISTFCSYNVGIDAHPLGPISIDEVIVDIKNYFGGM